MEKTINISYTFLSFNKTDEECLMHSSHRIMNNDKENEVMKDFF